MQDNLPPSRSGDSLTSTQDLPWYPVGPHRFRILAEGDIVGWKKCRDNVIVKLRIPADAKRSHAFGRKCRAEFADVLEVIGAERGVSIHDGKTEYLAGQRVTPDGFDEDWREECSTGVHFYISRVEAEAHS